VVLELMRRHVVPTPVDPAIWKAAMVAEYAEQFGTEPSTDGLTESDSHAVDRMDSRLLDEEFLAGTSRPVRAVRTVKVRAGVWVHDWSAEGERVVLGVAGGNVEVATGREHLVGLPLDEARQELEREREAAPLVSAIRAALAEVA
jgi:hypothetical protein